MESVIFAIVFGPLSWLYRGLSWLDRALTRTHQLPRPVISVGNIAMGGRAKTPFVIYLCRKLKSAGFAPVVLTRGYGRKIKDPVTWTGGVSDDLRMGDEAVEIARSGAVEAILVGKDRAANAQAFLMSQKNVRPWVFVLDDGFQHWALARDIDIVLVNDKDLTNRVVPWGELRESPAALGRATFVLELGKDLEKDTELAVDPAKVTQPLILTTRANYRDYHREIKKRFLAAVPCGLRDHATSAQVLKAVRGFSGTDVILGDKEAVKLFTEAEFAEWQKSGVLTKRYQTTEKKFYRASLRLHWKNEHAVLQKIFERLRGKAPPGTPS